MNKKLKVIDFSTIVGCSQKTVYRMIKKGELLTVNEMVNGRKVAFIITNDKQIEEIKKNQAPFTVNEGNYEESLSNAQNDKAQNAEILNIYAEKLLEINKVNNEQLMNLTNELITYKSQVPLLEDKANREGLYLQEIKDLKKVNNRYLIVLITVIILSVLSACVLCVLLVIEKKKPPKIVETQKVIEKEVEKPVYKYIYRK